MADIFISWAKEDKDLAEKLTKVLTSRGYSVWSWLDKRPADDLTTMKQQDVAKASIVIWTKHSVKSPLVVAEVDRAYRDQKLVPLKAAELAFEDIPLQFRKMIIVDIDAHRQFLWCKRRVILPDATLDQISDALGKLAVFPNFRERIARHLHPLLRRLPFWLGILALAFVYIFQGALAEFGRDLWKVISPNVFGQRP